MPPRPSSPRISYLPALVAVSIFVFLQRTDTKALTVHLLAVSCGGQCPLGTDVSELPRAELGFALEEAGDEGFLGFGLGGVGVGFEGGEALDGFGMLGIDFEDAAIERDGAPGEAHHFVKLTELEIGGSVPLVELEGQGEVADGVLTVLRDGGEAAREHGVMLGNVGGDFDAFAEPENG